MVAILKAMPVAPNPLRLGDQILQRAHQAAADASGDDLEYLNTLRGALETEICKLASEHERRGKRSLKLCEALEKCREAFAQYLVNEDERDTDTEHEMIVVADKAAQLALVLTDAVMQ